METIPPVTIISPHTEGALKHLQALWRSRNLIYWLARRDLILRYRQTAMGFFWAILHPAGLFFVYLFSLGYLAKLPMPNETPYSIYILTGLVPWIYFQTTLLSTSAALRQNLHLISKVYFPRLVLVITALITATFDFVWMLLVLCLVAMYYGYFNANTLWIVLFWSFIAGMLGMGVGLMVAALTIYCRDLNIALPVILQIVFFLSPIVYATFLIPAQYIDWYYFNPITAIIESFRGAFGLDSSVFGRHQIFACVVTVIVLSLSLRLFNRVERALVDLV